MEGLTGKVGELLLFKQYSYGTVITKIPDRSKVILSEKQVNSNKTFRKAVAYAKQILKDPKKCAVYQHNLPAGKTIYHTAIAEYFAHHTMKP